MDLFLIHSADQFFGRQQEIWKGMEAAKEAGLTKSIGVSNYRVQDLEELLAGSKVVPAVNQVCVIFRYKTPVGVAQALLLA